MQRPRRRILAAVAALAATLVPGCASPFHVHVHPRAVTADLAWTITECPDPPVGSPATCDGRQHEVDYVFKPAGAGPPYPAFLQVISFGEFGHRSVDDLRRAADAAVQAGMEREAIVPDERAPLAGERVLRNGLVTSYVVRNGTVESTGALFRDSARVRIIAEVAYDGRSGTSILAVGYAQVDIEQCTNPLPPLPRNCSNRPDTRSWVSMVGDEAGTIQLAQEPDGLVYNLVTHG